MTKEIVFALKLLLSTMERPAQSALKIYLFGMVTNALPAPQQLILTMIPKPVLSALKALVTLPPRENVKLHHDCCTNSSLLVYIVSGQSWKEENVVTDPNRDY
jgi:hypothetical protein